MYLREWYAVLDADKKRILKQTENKETVFMLRPGINPFTQQGG